jgi:hypothetical protein
LISITSGEKLFALTLRIVVRRIKEVDAAVGRRLDQFIGPALSDGADALEDPSAVPERHGSEAEFRNQETRIAERCVFHDVSFLLSPTFPWREGVIVGIGQTEQLALPSSCLLR